MNDLLDMMNQTCVYWASTNSFDKHGNSSYESGVEMDCRWQNSNQLFNDSQGIQFYSDAVVYFDGIDQVELEGYLYYGLLTTLTSAQILDPNLVPTSFRIAQVIESPSLDADEFLTKSFLKA